MELHLIFAELGSVCSQSQLFARFVILVLISVATILGLTTGTVGIFALSGAVFKMVTAGASFATIFSFISGDTITILGGAEILGAIVTAIMFMVHC